MAVSLKQHFFLALTLLGELIVPLTLTICYHSWMSGYFLDYLKLWVTSQFLRNLYTAIFPGLVIPRICSIPPWKRPEKRKGRKAGSELSQVHRHHVNDSVLCNSFNYLISAIVLRYFNSGMMRTKFKSPSVISLTVAHFFLIRGLGIIPWCSSASKLHDLVGSDSIFPSHLNAPPLSLLKSLVLFSGVRWCIIWPLKL